MKVEFHLADLTEIHDARQLVVTTQARATPNCNFIAVFHREAFVVLLQQRAGARVSKREAGDFDPELTQLPQKSAVRGVVILYTDSSQNIRLVLRRFRAGC